ncbi:MAG: glycosyltransferase family 4 protein [Flavobacteriales bacterium]|nr:glycosyltransferase family 4 protein [Flavobacteriales bacterium]
MRIVDCAKGLKDNVKKIGGGRNIGFLLRSLTPGGAEKQAMILARLLSGRHTVHVFVYYPEQVDHKFLDRIAVTSVDIISLHGSWLTKPFSFYRELKSRNIEVLFTYLLLANMVGGIIGWLAGVKLKVGGIRNSVLDPKKEPAERFLHNYVNNLSIFNNYCGVTLLGQKGFRKEKAVVIPNCFDIGKKLVVHRPERLVTILSVGRFTNQKDYLTAIRVMSKLKSDGLSFRYLAVGWGDLEHQVRQWVAEFDLTDRVEIVINPANMDDYYRDADIFLMTSLFEGLSNAVMEAMSFSLPIVATRAGDNGRLVDSEKNGFLAEIGDVPTLAKGLSELISSPRMRNEFGARSYEKLKNEYGEERFVERYEQFIEQNVK